MNRRIHHAFTLVEIIVVVAIVALLAGLLFMVFQNARFQAKIVDSVARQRQFHLAYMLYREDNGGDNGYYGDTSLMNLPPDSLMPFARQMYGLRLEQRKSPCGKHPNPRAEGWIMIPAADGSRWAREVKTYKENMILTFDMHCNSMEFDALADGRSKRGLGFLLSGQHVRRWRTGYGMDPEFWSDPQL